MNGRRTDSERESKLLLRNLHGGRGGLWKNKKSLSHIRSGTRKFSFPFSKRKPVKHVSVF